MRYCRVEGGSFPDREFELHAGVWYHRPEDGGDHVADESGPVIPLPPPSYSDSVLRRLYSKAFRRTDHEL